MLTNENIMKLLETNMDSIRKFGVSKIGLFGSYLTNQQHKDSDIDILVDFEKGKKTFDNYMDLKLLLEDLFHCKVDLVIFDAVKPLAKPYIYQSVKYASGD